VALSAAWTLLAFGRGVAFGWLFDRLGVPSADLGAEVRAWACAGLMLPVVTSGLVRRALHWG
jgi:hypothetical protein